ncbi:hypothetical protein FRB91_003586 [Serendipita sp. 411]|nr:hypothetical protein FRC18_005156 [Serendipita sp. 400]KAG8854379.1 hypothetical protein FRB91_003586 [Serendipita sp. 411]
MHLSSVSLILLSTIWGTGALPIVPNFGTVNTDSPLSLHKRADWIALKIFDEHNHPHEYKIKHRATSGSTQTIYDIEGKPNLLAKGGYHNPMSVPRGTKQIVYREVLVTKMYYGDRVTIGEERESERPPNSPAPRSNTPGWWMIMPKIPTKTRDLPEFKLTAEMLVKHEAATATGNIAAITKAKEELDAAIQACRDYVKGDMSRLMNEEIQHFYDKVGEYTLRAGIAAGKPDPKRTYFKLVDIKPNHFPFIGGKPSMIDFGAAKPSDERPDEKIDPQAWENLCDPRNPDPSADPSTANGSHQESQGGTPPARGTPPAGSRTGTPPHHQPSHGGDRLYLPVTISDAPTGAAGHATGGNAAHTPSSSTGGGGATAHHAHDDGTHNGRCSGCSGCSRCVSS